MSAESIRGHEPVRSPTHTKSGPIGPGQAITSKPLASSRDPSTSASSGSLSTTSTLGSVLMVAPSPSPLTVRDGRPCLDLPAQPLGHPVQEVLHRGFRHPVKQPTIDHPAEALERRGVPGADGELGSVTPERGDLQVAFQHWEHLAEAGGPPGDGKVERVPEPRRLSEPDLDLLRHPDPGAEANAHQEL